MVMQIKLETSALIINKRQRGTFSCTLPVKAEINCNNERNVAFTGTYMVTNRKKHAFVTVSMSPMLL